MDLEKAKKRGTGMHGVCECCEAREVITNEIGRLEEELERVKAESSYHGDNGAADAMVAQVEALTDELSLQKVERQNNLEWAKTMRSSYEIELEALYKKLTKAEEIIEAANKLASKLGTKDHPAEDHYEQEMCAMDILIGEYRDGPADKDDKAKKLQAILDKFEDSTVMDVFDDRPQADTYGMEISVTREGRGFWDMTLYKENGKLKLDTENTSPVEVLRIFLDLLSAAEIVG